MRIYLVISYLILAFCIQAQKQDQLNIALRHIEASKEAWKLKSSDISDLSVSDYYPSSHNGVTHIYFQQNYSGIPIYNAVTSVHVGPTGKVFESPSRFYNDLEKLVNTTTPKILPHQALENVVRELKLENALVPTNSSRLKKSEVSTLAKTNFTESDIPVKLVYQVNGKGELRLSYDLALDMSMNADHWSMRVDAVTGEVLNKHNFTIYCKIDHPGHSHCERSRMAQKGSFKPVAKVLESKALTTAPNTYNVFAFPVESPIHGSRSLVVNPADPTASPFGWHDTNGVAGPEFTVTNGNNVNAYLDKNSDNQNDGGQPNGGSDLIFDFPLDLNKEPNTYTAAAVTNLFYVCNAIHDVLYQFGFDEKAGNFQRNNYAKGGAANDPVVAEAQDGGGTNNANFSTPADGGSGRMQMFLWTESANEINVIEPSGEAGPFVATRGSFGAAPDTTPIIGNAVWSDDGVRGMERLGCSDSQKKAKLNGKIVFIERGECEFGAKAYYAQKAGAIAVIICGFNEESVSMGPGALGGRVTIPAYFAIKSKCDKVRILIDSSLKIKIQKPVGNLAGPDSLDGDFDNGIIAHEFGHGVSNRLTGGPSQAGCLGNGEQMGEGWSDFFSLIFTAEPGDKPADIRAVGNYAINAGKDGLGIRRRPYTTDLKFNEFTYKNIDPEVHNLGEVWTTVLWDLYWALSDKYGYDPSFKNKTAGNNICIQLVVDGMKLQPCSPGFIDGRNAIIAADQMNNGGKNKCLIWDVFAKRGFGNAASQGSSNSVGDETEDYESLPECINAIRFNKKADFVVKPGEAFNVELEVRNLRTSSANTVKVTDEIPANCTYVAGSASLAPTSVNGKTITWEIPTMAALEKLTITYKVATDKNIFSTTLWRDELETDFFETWDVEILEGGEIWQQLDYGINNSRALHANEAKDTTDFAVYMLNPAEAVLLGNEPSIYFYHQYNTQNTLDGGYLMVSEDGQIWERLSDSDWSLNGPNSDLSYSTFVVPNLRGFSGNSNGFIPSVANLSKWAGKKVYFKFRFGTYDNLVSTQPGRLGWTLDNLEIINPIYYNTTACVTSGLGDNICLASKGKGTLIESNKIVSVTMYSLIQRKLLLMSIYSMANSLK